jgi:hypothetical protein
MRPRWLLALMAPLCLACPRAPDTGDDDTVPPLDSAETGADDSSTDDTAPDLDCDEVEVGPDAPIRSLQVELTAMPTVIRVRWETAAASTGWVEYGASTLYEHHTPDEVEGTDHEVLLRGLHQSDDLHLRVRSISDHVRSCSPDQEASTGAFGFDLPSLSTMAFDPMGSAGGYTIAPLFAGTSDLVAILDAEGGYVWASTVTAGYRARLAQAAEGILVLRQASGPHEQATIARMGFDGTTLSQSSITGGHTDFVQVDGDSFAGISWRVCADGDTPVALAMAIVEVDEGGAERVVWSDLELEPPAQPCELVSGMSWPGSAMSDTASALNGIAYDPVDDAYLATARNWNGIVSVDRTTGTTNWMVRGNQQVEGGIEAPPNALVLPHSVERVEDNYLVLNQGLAIGSNARLVELAVDPDAQAVTEQWSWVPDDVTSIEVLGNAQRLWNGNSLAVWSTAGMIDEVTQAGTLVWKLEAPLDTQFGFAERVQSLY